jgi:hypothetical protein
MITLTKKVIVFKSISVKTLASEADLVDLSVIVITKLSLAFSTILGYEIVSSSSRYERDNV